MKTQTLVSALLAAGLAAAAPASSLAQDKHAHKPAAEAQAGQKSHTQMMDHMKQMHAEMKRIQETTDPAERDRLMKEHMAHMQQGMHMMRGMGGESMGMMGGGGMMQGGKRDAGRHDMRAMEKRMDMMQMMMEQMMQHQQMMQQGPAK